MAANFAVLSDQMDGIVGKCLEIQRLARLEGGCPWEPAAMNRALQLIVEGQFPGAKGPEPVAKVGAILKPFTTVDLPSVKRYSLKNTLKKGVVNGVKIAWVDPDIFKVFGDWVEEEVPATTLRVSQLTKNAASPSILSELGEDVAVTTWAHDWEILKMQGQGQSRPLRTDGWANLSYKKSQDGKFWLLDRFLYVDGWYFSLYSASNSHEWDADSHVVSG